MVDTDQTKQIKEHQQKRNGKEDRQGPEGSNETKEAGTNKKIKSQFNWDYGGNLVASKGAAAIELRGQDWTLLKK